MNTLNKIKHNKKYMKMAEIYKYWSINKNIADFSDEALLEAYMYETHGVKPKQENNIFKSGYINGYIDGKKWMDVDFSSWKKEVDKYGWDMTIRMLMNPNFYPIPGWIVKLALDNHIKNTWMGGRCKNYDNHLKLIKELEEM